jgi:DNA replication protein DnaC
MQPSERRGRACHIGGKTDGYPGSTSSLVGWRACVIPTFRQDLNAVIHCFEEAYRFFQGCPRRIPPTIFPINPNPMEIRSALKTILKKLKLSGMLATLPDRIAYARKEKLDLSEFLELVLDDEVERRQNVHLQNRLRGAGFEQECTLEGFDWSADIRVDKARLNDLFGLHFIERQENVILNGPVGVGKTFLACALGHAACRAGYRVLFARADTMLKTLAQSRADNSFDRELRRFLNPDLLVVDDFGLRKLSSHASSDFYELIIERHMRSSTIVTSNRLCCAPHNRFRIQPQPASQ